MSRYWRLPRDAHLLLSTTAIFGFSVYGVFTVLLNLYLLRLGYDARFVGILNAAGLLTIAFCSVPVGILGARWGVRRAMIAGLGLMVLCGGLMPVAEMMRAGQQAGWLLASTALALLGGTAYAVNSTPFLTGVTDEVERHFAFSVQSALSPLSAFAGSLIGGTLPQLFAAALQMTPADPAPYRWAVLLAALLLVPALLALLKTRAAPRTPKARLEQARPLPAAQGPAPVGLMALMALVVLLRYAGRGPVFTFFNVYLDTRLHLSTAVIGTLTAAGQLVSVPAALITPFLVLRLGMRRVIVWGALGVAGGLLLLAAVPHWSAAGLGYIGTAALFAVTAPAITAYHQEISPPGWRAPMSGAINMAVGLGQAGMAVGGGYLITQLGYQALFLAGISLTLAGALTFAVCLPEMSTAVPSLRGENGPS